MFNKKTVVTEILFLLLVSATSIFYFDVNGFTIATVRTLTFCWWLLTMNSKPTSVLDTFRFAVTPVMIRNITGAYRSATLIKAKDIWMRIPKFRFCSCIQRDERDNTIVV